MSNFLLSEEYIFFLAMGETVRVAEEEEKKIKKMVREREIAQII